MYNLLVVDDEELIRKGIADVLSSCGDLEFNIFCAENGLQALEIVERENIHAMVLDVKMPKLDGIGVLKTLNEKRKNIKTVVLSGYEEFEYAKAAIECGALNYLVKPVVPREIVKVAREIEEELKKESKQNEELENLRKQMQDNLDLIKEKLLNDILSNRISREAFKERVEFLKLGITGSEYQAAIIDIIKYNYFLTEEKCQLINYSIYQFLKGYISSIKGAEYFHGSSGQFVIIFSFPHNQVEDIRETLHALKKIIDSKFNVCSTVGIGKAYTGFENIKRTYLEALNTVRYEVLSGRENVASITDIQATNTSLDYLFDPEEFLTRMKLGDNKGINAQLNEIFERIKAKNEYNIDIESFNLFCIRLLVYSFMVLKELDVDLRSVGLNEKEAFIDIFESRSFDQIKNKIFNIIGKVTGKVEEYKMEKKKVTIERVKNIINQNYGKDISIKFIADQLYLNPNYLGQLFKNETSMTISDYLNKVRITKAKTLLKSTSLAVYEVAEQVGFNDPQYFSTVFKKTVGVSPKEYKDI